MRESLTEAVERFVAGCHKAAGHQLMRCSSGNISYRMDDDRMLVTATRTWMADLKEEEVSLCRISDGLLVAGKKSTVETGFHAGILRTRKDVNVVMHFQTPAATAIACMDLPDPDFFVIPEIPYYIGPIARVPFLIPGSPELAEAVTQGMADHDMVIMGNHGQVTVGASFDDVIQKAAFFELACEVILKAGPRLKPLSPEDVGRLRSLAMEGRRGLGHA